MSSDTLLTYLVILNLLMLNSAYRIHDPRQILILPYEDYVIIDREFFDMMNSKPTLDNYDCLISCDLQTPLIINQPIRRDTKFLRFGRKR